MKIGEIVTTYSGLCGIVEKLHKYAGKEYCTIRTEDGKLHRVAKTQLLVGRN